MPEEKPEQQPKPNGIRFVDFVDWGDSYKSTVPSEENITLLTGCATPEDFKNLLGELVETGSLPAEEYQKLLNYLSDIESHSHEAPKVGSEHKNEPPQK